MHSHITKLYQLAAKPSRRIIGLMSGTSLDGLDIALCNIHGSGQDSSVKVEQFMTVPYTDDFRSRVQAVFAKRQVDLQQLTLLHPWIAEQHAQMINQALRDWQVPASEVDLIASHGQTVYHCPKRQHQDPAWGNATLQLGDGDHLAVHTGIITVSDFRQKHIAAGGEGAPLAAYGDYLLFGSATEHRILLNIGGIANLTYLPAGETLSGVFSTDIGPGNTLMDAYVRQHFPGLQYDADARLATTGNVQQKLLAALLAAEFFQLSLPKTTGPEVFNLAYLARAQQQSGCQDLPAVDVLATLNAFSAQAIIKLVQQLLQPERPTVLYASGGGIHNPLLMQQLKQGLPQLSLTTTAELAILPDAKEAVLFALLANECVAGTTTTFNHLSTGMPAVTMGKISFAD
jgi:anhydro-N-acetylmuramic acid kinase